MDAGNCPSKTVDCLRCGVRSRLLCLLTEDEIGRVNATKLNVVYRKGETIRKQGTFLSHVLIIRAGYAKVYLEGPGERNNILRIVQPTNFIGGPGLHHERLHHYSVTALTRTEVCHIDANLFLELLASNPAFASEYMKDYSINTLSVYTRLANITQKQMPGRLADSLLYFFDEVIGGKEGTLHLSRQDLADLSAMSKESAIKTLREFQRSGAIAIRDESIELMDRDTLLRISRTG